MLPQLVNNPNAAALGTASRSGGHLLSPSRRRGTGLLLALLVFAQFISAIDYNIGYVALPEIGREVGCDAHNPQWVVSGYAVAF
ncbi:hypothetical protein AB0J28_02865 [Streptosporangium canum]|uniref:hypothetical protein n=1 Tax=Streptosporangium canum TaxID=324952 RepID=UPI003426BA8C